MFRINFLLGSVIMFFTLFLSFFSMSCENRLDIPERIPYEVPQLLNPVFEPNLSMPSVLRTWDGWFYAYGSESAWGDGGGNRLIPVLRSADLINWTIQRNAFNSKPNWPISGSKFYSPSIIELNKTYILYYGFGPQSDLNQSIGVATSITPAGPFVDQGLLLDETITGIPSTQLPFLIQSEEGNRMIWLSKTGADTDGFYISKISDNGLSVIEPSKPFKIASKVFSKVSVIQKGKYYFLFCSKQNMDGYEIYIGRSEKVNGPYLDAEGKSLLEEGGGKLFLKGNEKWKDPMNIANLFTDKKNEDWILYNAIDVANPTLPVSAAPPRIVLMMDKVIWKSDWPEVDNNMPSVQEQPGTDFH